MGKNINADVFTEETKLKLQIFAECFREWLPVFIHHSFVNRINIFDLFAGSGKDAVGNFGSSLILLDKARGKYCDAVIENNKEIIFSFNEKDSSKQQQLVSNINSFIDNCLKTNCKQQQCVYHHNFGQFEFKDVFDHSEIQQIFSNNSIAKFVLLDQYGFSQVDESVFLKLVNSPMTDFIFFISSSFIRRFKEIPAVTHYFDTKQIPFNETKPRECHRQIADYFENIIPQNKEYYVHNFTIKKGKNYWGLIFGTSHTLGMEKFLKVCWEKDKSAGESNFNIDNDFQQDSLFYEAGTSNKLIQVQDELRDKVLSGIITDNHSGLKYAMKRRCMPKTFVDVVADLIAKQKVKCTPKFNKQATNIHRADFYKIEVLQ